MLEVYPFTSAIECSIHTMYSLYFALVSAVVLMLSALVGMVILPGYVVYGLLVAYLTLAALYKPLFPDRYSEYAFGGGRRDQ